MTYILHTVWCIHMQKKHTKMVCVSVCPCLLHTGIYMQHTGIALSLLLLSMLNTVVIHSYVINFCCHDTPRNLIHKCMCSCRALGVIFPIMGYMQFYLHFLPEVAKLLHVIILVTTGRWSPQSWLVRGKIPAPNTSLHHCVASSKNQSSSYTCSRSVWWLCKQFRSAHS